MINISDLVSKTCAIVVTYNPDNFIVERVKRIATQVGSVVVIDNNSSKTGKYVLASLTSLDGCYVIYNPSNIGVASALNLAIRWAKERKYEWIITFDQDTSVNENMIESLSAVYSMICDNDDFSCIVGSNYLDDNSKKYLYGDNNSNISYKEVKTVITSGCLIPVKIFDDIGYFRDEFFIDFVDIEFCLRARACGYKIFLMLKPLMHHAIGDATTRSMFFMNAGTSNHKAFRRYFMARNFVIVIREYMLKEPMWVLSTIYSRIKSLLLMLLLEDDKYMKVRLTFQGIVDGFTDNFTRKVNVQ